MRWLFFAIKKCFHCCRKQGLLCSFFINSSNNAHGKLHCPDLFLFYFSRAWRYNLRSNCSQTLYIFDACTNNDCDHHNMIFHEFYILTINVLLQKFHFPLSLITVLY